MTQGLPTRQNASGRTIVPWLALLVVLALPLSAAWDPAKPAANSTAVSAEIRANWTAIAQAVGAQQLVADSTLRVWAAGDAAAPSYYVLAGAGASVARTGTDLPDTARKFGAFAAKVTSAAATATLTQALLSTASYDDGFDGLAVSCGAYTRSTSANSTRIAIADGAGTTYSGYNTGSGTWQWFTVTRTLSASATKIDWLLQVETGTLTGYVSGPTCVLGPIPPSYPATPVWTRGEPYRLTLAGTVTTGTVKARWTWPQRAGLVDDVQLYAGTAPTGQALIVDVNTWDGAAFTSMFSTRPQIAAGANRGNAAPDGTYARRAFLGLHGTSVAAGGELTIDVDQVGSGTAGADLVVNVRPSYPVRPLEAFVVVTE